MNPITLVLNPNARHLKMTALTEEHFRALLPADSEVHLTRNLGELDTLMSGIISNWEHGEQTLCFFGGDGSISQGITSFIRHHGEAQELPAVLPVRAGTMNMLCNQSGKRESAQQTLENWVARKEYHLRAIPTLKVEVEGELPRYGFVFAWGIGFRVLSEYYRRNESPNVMDAAAVATQTFLQALNPWGGKLPLFRKDDLELAVDGGTPVAAGYHSLVAGTIPSLSLGIRPFPPGTCAPRRFQFSANGMPLRQVAMNAPTLLFGLSDQRHLAFDQALVSAPDARELSARLTEGFTMDGEIFRLEKPTQVRLSGGPTVKFWMKKPA